MVQTGISLLANTEIDHPISVTWESLGFLSPFTREFYSNFEYIKILKSDRFETIKESIIDINPSFTVFQGKYKGEPIIVREILEKYTSMRQWMSVISGRRLIL